ncbi:hypothetical protein AB0O91_28185 [Kitasatospora sp. NPDC089797]|uniref:hypothetical protein n=1 Tax=Kitasatospora sp. NPDC089797 TaxID=3155298 RepID=UPI00341EE2BC
MIQKERASTPPEESQAEIEHAHTTVFAVGDHDGVGVVDWWAAGGAVRSGPVRCGTFPGVVAPLVTRIPGWLSGDDVTLDKVH